MTNNYTIKLSTATGGTRSTIVDSNQNWIQGEHIGKMIYIYKKGYKEFVGIKSNTTTEITFNAEVKQAVVAGDEYYIENPIITI